MNTNSHEMKTEIEPIDPIEDYQVSEKKNIQNKETSENSIEKNKSFCNKKCFCSFLKSYWILLALSIFVIGGTILLSIPVVKNEIEILINEYGTKLTKLSWDYFWTFNLAFIFIHIILTVLLLPGEAITMVLSGFVTRNIVRAFLLNFIGNFLSVCIVWNIVHFCLRDKCLEKHKESRHFKVISRMVEEGPWVASPLCWLISIPLALRCYILSILYNKF